MSYRPDYTPQKNITFQKEKNIYPRRLQSNENNKKKNKNSIRYKNWGYQTDNDEHQQQ